MNKSIESFDENTRNLQNELCDEQEKNNEKTKRNWTNIFSSYPHNIVKAINDDISYGYNTWRLPTEEELSLINNNKEKLQGMSSSGYMTIDGSNSGRVRLVTNREKQEVRSKAQEDYFNKFPADNVNLDYLLNYISANPKMFSSAYTSVGQLYIQQKEYANAIAYLKQAIEIQPDYIDALAGLADCYIYINNANGDYQSKELAIKYAKLGAKFGHKGCIEWLNGQNIRW